jgi:hypothetical protein
VPTAWDWAGTQFCSGLRQPPIETRKDIMKHSIKLALCVAAGAALAGCVEDTGGMAVSPASPPMITTFDGSVSQAAISACVSAVDAQTDGEVRLVGSEFSQANSAVFLRVGPNGAPWRCLTSNDGRVAEVMFMGSEGAA